MIKIKKLNEFGIIPKYQTVGSSGFDLHSSENYILAPLEIRAIGTSLSIELPIGFELQVRGRSGLSLKGISLANGVGTIDSDYRGELKVILINHSQNHFEIKVGDRIAQGVVQRVGQARIMEVDNLSSTNRGSGGFGSIGI